MSIRDKLIVQIESWNVEMPERWDVGASLISSGILDSLGLFRLILWIEEQIGSSLDPTKIDLARELDTIADIVRFVEKVLNSG